LGVGRSELAAANNNNYAFFAGGTSGSYSSKVDAYNKFLTYSSPSSLS
jgi:hypothetical protein